MKFMKQSMNQWKDHKNILVQFIHSTNMSRKSPKYWWVLDTQHEQDTQAFAFTEVRTDGEIEPCQVACFHWGFLSIQSYLPHRVLMKVKWDYGKSLTSSINLIPFVTFIQYRTEIIEVSGAEDFLDQGCSSENQLHLENN